MSFITYLKTNKQKLFRYGTGGIAVWITSQLIQIGGIYLGVYILTRQIQPLQERENRLEEIVQELKDENQILKNQLDTNNPNPSYFPLGVPIYNLPNNDSTKLEE